MLESTTTNGLNMLDPPVTKYKFNQFIQTSAANKYMEFVGGEGVTHI